MAGSIRETVTGERGLRPFRHRITSRIDEKRPNYSSIVSNWTPLCILFPNVISKVSDLPRRTAERAGAGVDQEAYPGCRAAARGGTPQPEAGRPRLSGTSQLESGRRGARPSPVRAGELKASDCERGDRRRAGVNSSRP